MRRQSDTILVDYFFVIIGICSDRLRAIRLSGAAKKEICNVREGEGVLTTKISLKATNPIHLGDIKLSELSMMSLRDSSTIGLQEMQPWMNVCRIPQELLEIRAEFACT